MAPDTLDIVFIFCIACVITMPLLAIMDGGAGSDLPSLGDEVTTTPEYTAVFNDSFSGNVVSITDLYMIRDDNGTERAFESKWIVSIDNDE